MAYLSLYRKYRSQSFDEVSGQDHVIRTLQNAIRTGRVAHAYLFCGPRGTGKTSTARLLAKALNCDRGPTPEPCNTCEACIQIAEGRYMDIKEIDAASNRGIEDIRDLRDSVAYSPTQGRFKVYVIDEAHQITGDAFNAFLKTLEEPPPYVVFIMATTEAHKIPATIVSRCQRFEFRRASLDDLRSRVQYVAEQEGATLDDAALDLIAREANGGWRDALSVLEQVLSFCDGRITAREVYAVLGTVEADTLHALADCILRADGAEAFRLLEQLISEGKDPRQLLRDLTQHFRSLMLAGAGSTVTRDAEQAARLNDQARRFGQMRLISAIEVLALTDREARWSEQPRLLLELAVVRLMHPRAAAAVEEAPVPRRVEPSRPAPEPTRSVVETRERPPQAARPAPARPSPFVDEPPPAEPEPEFAAGRGRTGGEFGTYELPPPPLTVGDARTGRDDPDDEDLGAMFGSPLSTDPAPQPPPARPAPAPRPTPPAAAPPRAAAPASSGAPGTDADLEVIRRKWRLINEELKRQRKVHIHAALTDTEPDRFEHDTLVVRFQYQTYAELFQRRISEFGPALSQAIETVVGVSCRIRPEAAAKGTGKTPPAGGATPARTPVRSAPRAPSAAARPPVAEPARPAIEAPARPAVEAPAGPVSAPPPTPPRNDGAASSAYNPHLTHDVLEIFDGEIVDGPVDP